MGPHHQRNRSFLIWKRCRHYTVLFNFSTGSFRGVTKILLEEGQKYNTPSIHEKQFNFAILKCPQSLISNNGEFSLLLYLLFLLFLILYPLFIPHLSYLPIFSPSLFLYQFFSLKFVPSTNMTIFGGRREYIGKIYVIEWMRRGICPMFP